jgi:cytochrome c oxidase accessory protein FixG
VNGDAAQIIAKERAVSASEPAAGFAPVDLYQRREKIFTRSIEGRFQRIRMLSGWPLLIGYFAVPWLQWGERQAVLFDLPARQFHVLGVTFWPQDFVLLGALLIIAAFALFTFTSVVGRIWCGYTCPQTVWTAIYMWMEQFAEGPRHVRIRLDQAPWNFEKIRKRGLKHGLWLGWAFFTGFTFVGYFTPIRELIGDVVHFELSAWPTFWIAFFTAATYVNAGWLREQVCIYMCPYARFQSAMFDEDTLIVSYDAARGEPRGSRKRGVSAQSLGDCVDCQLCVQVCPTGIDIRDGLQYECIGCAHCVDACDDVMTKVGYAPGLIRYTTSRELAGGTSRLLRPRVIGYASALVIMCGLFVYALLDRSLVGIDVIRGRGELYQLIGDDVRNDYELKLMNKSQKTMRLQIGVSAAVPVSVLGPTEVDIDPGEVVNVPISLVTRRRDMSGSAFDARIEVCGALGQCDSEVTRFLGPTT